ncbi:uncharacterized protein TRAVEDRAFT_65718 [Trametes versicolor FP-101664 SS1]|uniref:uncharacterized protein n=1 Tax=Trametes versicolor (strain FP-101664) TaxID=717944 RepID=UPI000462228C|nr:uncharacterized protein TRAVEDRAFT_65718 [Trametes versicolor FP-101664 SS1]EIW56545.1 hypothetical protein TRAVEDRAFT_65718 [Trametes versicolor FP-101664 SS1]
MAQMKTLPTELVIAILEEAQYEDLLPRYKWLKRYSRVCHAWRAPAQRLLFSHVALLRGAAQCKAFKDAVTDLSSADPAHLDYLRESVKTLAMAVDHQEVYAEVIELCPNLRELHLSLYHASFRPDVLARLVRGPRVEAIRVKTYHLWPLVQLLSVYGTVQYLEIDFNSVREEFAEEPDLLPPLTQLRELRYFDQLHRTHPLVKWTLSGPSQKTLEVLELRCSGIQLEMLAGVGPRLRSLAIAGLGGNDDVAAVAPALEELVVLASFPITVSLVQRFPASLVHLAIQDLTLNDRCLEDVDALAAHYANAGTSLRVLSFHCRRGEPEKAARRSDALALFESCKAAGIEFRFFEPPYGHYAWERMPLESVRMFPRQMPFSERRATTMSGEQLSEEYAFSKTRGKSSFVRRVAKAAGKAFGSSIPPMALAKP